MTTPLKLENYLTQKVIWPDSGRHILGQFTNDYIIVYQAYRPAIGHFAASHQYFGGEFRYNRMSWIKPNFLWMMYRSGWGAKPGQEVVLAIKLHLDYFNSILADAVFSSFDKGIYQLQANWKMAKSASNVRLQWDPDHSPRGGKLQRRAVQLGLKNEMLLPFQGEGIIEVNDISEFVREQRSHALSGDYENLYTPRERVYRPDDASLCQKIGLDLTAETPLSAS